jgi:hypothetical protein
LVRNGGEGSGSAASRISRKKGGETMEVRAQDQNNPWVVFNRVLKPHVVRRYFSVIILVKL